MALRHHVALCLWTYWTRSGFEATEAHVLILQILVDPVLGALATQTGLFDPTEGGLCGGDETLVDSDHAHLQHLGHSPYLTHVL